MSQILNGLGLYSNFTDGENGWTAKGNENFSKLDALTSIGFLGFVASLPLSANLGDMLILNSTGQVAIWETGWVLYEPRRGLLAVDINNGYLYYYDGNGWETPGFEP